MRGGAQSHLIEADDGHYYIVKFLNNPQGRRILINELLGTEIFRYLHLAAPPYQIVEITREFLDHNPDVYMQLGSRRREVEPGWHFGSRCPGHPGTMGLYDILPDVLIAKVCNRTDFLGAMVADKWLSNSDGRQAVYFRGSPRQWTFQPGHHPSKKDYIALLIDHGYVLDGPNWTFGDAAVSGRYHRPFLYEDVTGLASFQPWLDQVRHLPLQVLDDAYKRIPPQWFDRDQDLFEGLLDQLAARRSRVDDLLRATRDSSARPFPNWRDPVSFSVTRA